MTGRQLQQLRAKHGLSQPQLAILIRRAVKPQRASGSGRQSNQIGRWENDEAPIPEAMAELIRAKLFMLEANLATYEDLIAYQLDELLRDIYS